jgi:predicted amidophosphoribosyltransferase
MACKSQFAKTKGYCPVCKAPVIQDMIDHEDTLKTWRKDNA